MKSQVLESDTAVKEATNAQLIGLLLLRQSSLVKISDDHPHRSTILAAKQSAEAEILRRLKRVYHIDGPKIVCLCGSTRFWKTFQEQQLKLSTEGIIVLSIGSATASDSEHLANGTITPDQKRGFDELHKRKIDLADEVLVLNVGGYIGESTRSEIEYAMAHGKPVAYLQ